MLLLICWDLAEQRSKSRQKKFNLRGHNMFVSKAKTNIFVKKNYLDCEVKKKL